VDCQTEAMAPHTSLFPRMDIAIGVVEADLRL